MLPGVYPASAGLRPTSAITLVLLCPPSAGPPYPVLAMSGGPMYSD